MKKIGVSPITHKIYIGKTKIDKSGVEIWTSKEDITDQAVKAVFEHLYLEAREAGQYGMSVEGYGTLTFTRQ